MRLIDRPVRPLWPDGFNDEVQIMATVVSVDKENDPDTVAMNASFAALHLAPIPFQGPIAAARVGYVNGQYVLNPTAEELEDSWLDLVVAGSAEEIKRIANPKVDIFSKDYPVLTEVISGKREGRIDKSQVTFFANSGTQGLQFASTAGYVVREAKKRGLGQEIPTDWFLQDIRD